MELQWPLILFTTFLAWSAGLFAAQCVYALRGVSPKVQMPAWIVSAILLIVGGVAVFFHLEHWGRIFNGFGHITSGITQELIAIVVLAVVALVYLAFMRRREGAVPSWVAWAGIAISVVLVVVMSHSYMMAARPAWNSIWQILSVLGAACVMGPSTAAFIRSLVDKEETSGHFVDLTVLAGPALNAATTVAYVVALAFAGSKYVSMGHYFDPTHPTKAMVDTAMLSPFNDGLFATVVAVVAAVAALACAFASKKSDAKTVWVGAAVVLGFVSALALRVLFYQMGGSTFIFY